jgi:hypothetical protein
MPPAWMGRSTKGSSRPRRGARGRCSREVARKRRSTCLARRVRSRPPALRLDHHTHFVRCSADSRMNVGVDDEVVTLTLDEISDRTRCASPHGDAFGGVSRLGAVCNEVGDPAFGVPIPRERHLSGHGSRRKRKGTKKDQSTNQERRETRWRRAVAGPQAIPDRTQDQLSQPRLQARRRGTAKHARGNAPKNCTLRVRPLQDRFTAQRPLFAT